MSDEELGFDPTVQTDGEKRYIDIEREGHQERIILTELVKHDRSIEGRATKCWTSYLENNPTKKLVVKDVWEPAYGKNNFGSREGNLLKKMTQSNVVNVVRHYHHYVVCIGNQEEDVAGFIRQELTDRFDNPDYHVQVVYGKERSEPVSQLSVRTIPDNRAHLRIILCDVGAPIYKPKSLKSLVSATKCCIEGHKSLLQAGYLHRKISVSNLMIDVDDENRGFLIDLEPAGGTNKTLVYRLQDSRIGTREFMSIRLIEDERSGNSLADDMESFFWVLLWICVHYNGKGEYSGNQNFDIWHNEIDDILAIKKRNIVSDTTKFEKIAKANFTQFYKPMIPLMEELRKMLFTDAIKRQSAPEMSLYDNMLEILDKGPQLIIQTENVGKRATKRKSPSH